MNNPKYFDKIALGFSGGGFRSSVFSLGILSFLDNLDLLDSVRAISSVSGGSITAAKYAESQAKGEDFKMFYESFYTWLLNDELLPGALKKFNSPKKGFKDKHHNLINAFALEYQDSLVKMNYDDLRKGLKKHKSSLEEFIINATDFENGLAFRFRSDKSGVFGNSKYQVPLGLNNEIKLSDAIAASSCFPGGFEPMKFPNDFIVKNVIKNKTLEPIGLMDGGIIDNLGAQSFITTNKLKYTTYLISDAGKFKIDPFNFTEKNKLTRFISSLFSWWTLTILILLSILSYNYLGIGKMTIALFGLTFIIVIIQLVLESLLKIITRYTHVGIPLKIKRHDLGIMLINRLKSLKNMTSSIFLKIGKSKNLQLLYEEDGEKISKLSIYKLAIEGDKFRSLKYQNELIKLGIKPSKYLSDLSEITENFGTTLWFKNSGYEAKEIIKHLLHVGKAVCCISLIQYIYSREKEKTKDLELFKKLKQSWEELSKKIEPKE